MNESGVKIRFNNYLSMTGLKAGENIIVHASFKRIREAFPAISPEEVLSSLKELTGSYGSVIFPAFTYCFRKSAGSFETFDSTQSPSKTGILSEMFRKSEGVIRTSSPTHSFSLWGKAADEISSSNSPSSPLGLGSTMDWLARRDESYVMMLGTDFTSLTLGHYIENISGAEYLGVSPWKHMNVLPCGVSVMGEQALTEIPGCSRSFTGFEDHLLKEGKIKKYRKEGLNSYYLSIPLLIQCGKSYLRNHPAGLLCPEGICRACDERHIFLKQVTKEFNVAK